MSLMDGGDKNGGVILEVGGAKSGDDLQNSALRGQGGDGSIFDAEGLNNSGIAELFEFGIGGFGNAIGEKEQAVTGCKLNGEILVLPVRQDAQNGAIAAEQFRF